MFGKYVAKIDGITPLISHYDNVEWEGEIQRIRKEIKQNDKANFSAGDDRCPADTWKGYLYRDINDEFVAIPSDNIRACLIRAGAKVTLKKQESFKRAMASGISFDGMSAETYVAGKKLKFGDCCAIKGNFRLQSEAVKNLGFRLMVKRASVGTSKHVRVRPVFDKWNLIATFDVIDQRIDEASLREVWRGAGLYIGLGDWRPDSPKSPGPFGKFTVELEKIG